MSDDTLLGKIAGSINDAVIIGDHLINPGETKEEFTKEKEFLLPPSLKEAMVEPMRKLGFPLKDSPTPVTDYSEVTHYFYGADEAGGILVFLYIRDKRLESASYCNDFCWIADLFNDNRATGLYFFSDSYRVERAYRTRAEAWMAKKKFKHVEFFDHYDEDKLINQPQDREKNLHEWLNLDTYTPAAQTPGSPPPGGGAVNEQVTGAGAGSIPPQKGAGKQPAVLKILFLAADPSDATRLRTDEEYREINEQLTLATLHDQVELLKPVLSVRVKDMTRSLLTEQPQIVHFAGHGTAEGGLCFENENGQVQIVEPDALAALFEQFQDQVHFVVLNACYAEAQARAIAKHINYVIGMNDEIDQKAAIVFSRGFYQALGEGKGIEKAFNLGCVQIQLEGIPGQSTPVLIKKEATDHVPG